MKILTAAEMREVDRLTAERCGVPNIKLMEAAGRSVAELIRKHVHGRAHKMVVLCGRGNNGGDGFVAARYLRESGAHPELLLFGEPGQLGGDAAANYKRLSEAGAEIRVVREAKEWAEAKRGLERAEIILDALLGTGARGAPEGLPAEAIEIVNRRTVQRRGPWPLIFAVDIPSGLSADTGETSGPVIRADFTVTFTAPKIGMVLGEASRAVGRLQVARIGSPPSLIEETGKSDLRWLDAAEVAEFAAPREASGHKGDYGHALIIAGSGGKPGAAVLASWAAVRAGAGLVTLLSAGVWPEARLIPEVMRECAAVTRDGTMAMRVVQEPHWPEILEGKRAMGMGPGMGTNRETQRLIRKIVAERPVPLILDADGLNAFAGRAKELRGAANGRHRPRTRELPALAITPHPGEMSRLIGRDAQWIQANRIECARRAAAEWNVWAILKGHQTVIAAPPADGAAEGAVWINSTGNPGMGTGGTGDVLTGMLAGLAAQHASRDWAGALKFGVYLHGLAGDKAAEEKSEASLMASDVIEAIPRAHREFLAEARELCGEKS